MIRRHLALVLPLIAAACAPEPARVVEPRVSDVPAPRGEALLQSTMLADQNAERVPLALVPLVWDEALARDALAYARVLAETGRFEHSIQPANAPHEGENLFKGTLGAYSYREMVGYWVAEKKDFVNVAVPASSRTGRFGDVGHYVQIVWRVSQRVGCALASSRTDDYLVCRYSPSGNVFGYKAY